MDAGTGVTEFQISGGPRAPLSARAKLSDSLGPRLDPPVLDDVRLLVSELVTNCVLHGGADESNRIIVRASVAEEALVTEVCHDGPAFTPPGFAPDLDTPGGLGLFLVERMASAWGIAGNCRTCVWFELCLRT